MSSRSAAQDQPATAAPVTAPGARLSRAVVVPLIIASALFLQNLDATVLATAVPAIAADFHVRPTDIGICVTSYIIAVAVFTPASGWIADRFGARKVFQTAILIFLFGSMLCGISRTLVMMVSSRAVQGLGGALMLPVGRLILLREVDRSELVRAFSYLTVPALIGPILGPPVGGFLVTYASWHWIFFINIPVGVLGLVCSYLFISNIREADTPPFDSWGLVYSAIALPSLMLGAEALRFNGGLRLVAPLLAVAALFGWLSIRHSRLRARPLLDYSLMKVQTFRASIIGGSLFRIGTNGVPFLLALLLQVGFKRTAFAAGLVTFSSAAGALVMKPATRFLLNRLGFRTVLLSSGMITGVFVGLCAAFTLGVPAWVMMLVLFIAGLARSLQFSAIMSIGFADLPKERMSSGTTLSGIFQQVSLALGVVAGASLAQTGAGAGGLTPHDFIMPFAVIAVICMASGLAFAGLPPEAGAHVSGHVKQPAA